MRLDVYLTKTGLIKHRADAKVACDRGAVTLDGLEVKPARRVCEGQRIRILYPRRVLEVEVMGIPEGPVRKSERTDYYRVLEERRRDWDA